MQYQLYSDATHQWRWRFVTNGRTIADSGESYVNKQDAERGIEIMKNSTTSPVIGPGLLGGIVGGVMG